MTLHLIIATDPSLPTTIDPPADIIIFPEIAVGGYTGLRATGRYYRPSSSEVQDFRTLSRRTQMSTEAALKCGERRGAFRHAPSPASAL